MKDQLDKLLDYCQINGRVCPHKWQELWEMLPDRKPKDTGGWNPPLPLILGAWYGTSDYEKRERLKEHLMYAMETGVLDKVDQFLRELSEDQWHHENE